MKVTVRGSSPGDNDRAMYVVTAWRKAWRRHSKQPAVSSPRCIVNAYVTAVELSRL
jgi:hypothetical protein